MTSQTYDPQTTRLRAFHTRVSAFLDGSDTPRAYLERCLEEIDRREGEVQAFVTLNVEGARKAADASTERYAAGKPLSEIDGMPFGIKDLFETEDMPTQCGSPIFKDNHTGRDCALIAGLREAGAIILGKTVTTEFAFYNPGPTRNPFDTARTPGGSSSGSGAAVGAGFVPVAIGSQVVGSLIRPSSYNANYGFKPSFGAINREGAYSNLSQTALGTHAASLTDAWIAARVAAKFAGGDPGYIGLTGDVALPNSVQPARLARLDSAGWGKTPTAIRAKFEALLDKLTTAGAEISTNSESARLEGFEQIMAPALDVTNAICGYEFLWPLKYYYRRDPSSISKNIADRLADWEQITTEQYAVLLDERNAMRAAHDALSDEFSAFITLSATGPAPEGHDWTGDPIYAVNSSILGAPAINLPLLEAEGMPLGIQLIGYPRKDRELFAYARWILDVLGLPR
ncbi:amidase [Nioella sp.]|uniref:amidase n=1 Tax=Nioella sp. TaxID=1912091 RepID=UPI003A883387